MKVSAECMHWLVKRQAENIKKYADEEKKAEYLGKVLGIIANGAAEEPAPVLLSHIGRLHEAYFGKPFSCDELKKGYNAMLMEKEEEIRQKISKADDPLALALRFSQIGNYIDFGALGSVDDDKLRDFLEQAETLPISEDTYLKFTENLKTTKKLVFLTDNCGEIVLDKLLLETIAKAYPHLECTVIVRGEPVLNDATMEDALQVGIDTCGKVNYMADEIRAENMLKIIRAGYGDHIMVSDDVSRRTYFVSHGGVGYIAAYKTVLPLLKEYGATDEDIRKITTDNPARILDNDWK